MSRILNRSFSLAGRAQPPDIGALSNLARNQHKGILLTDAATKEKKLTESDRRLMREYHKDNPTVKQAKIGGKKLASYVRH